MTREQVKVAAQYVRDSLIHHVLIELKQNIPFYRDKQTMIHQEDPLKIYRFHFVGCQSFNCRKPSKKIHPLKALEKLCVSNLSTVSDSETFFFAAFSSLDLLSCVLRSWGLVPCNLVSMAFTLSRIGADIFLAEQSGVSFQEICTGVQHFPKHVFLITLHHITSHIFPNFHNTEAHTDNTQDLNTLSQRHKHTYTPKCLTQRLNAKGHAVVSKIKKHCPYQPDYSPVAKSASSWEI